MAHFLATICPHFVKNAAWCNPVYIFGTFIYLYFSLTGNCAGPGKSKDAKETKDDAKEDDVKDDAVLDPGPGTSKDAKETKKTKETKKRKRAKKCGSQKKKAMAKK